MSEETRKLGRDLDVGLVTHVGMVRSENQDHADFFQPADEEELRRKGRLLVVCDGMGGHNGGTIASHTAVEHLIETFSQSASSTQKRLLSASIDEANQAVRSKGARDPKLRNMGTTCVALAVRGPRVQIAHVGDSRAYLIRNGTIDQVTKDHTYLNDLIEIGLLTPEKAKNHPERNIITRCVGMADSLEVDFNTVEGRAGDTFLLCSDGLYNHVESEEMLEAVDGIDCQQAAQKLVDLANSRGGEDNITVALLRINELPEEFEDANAEDPLEERTPVAVTPVVPLEETSEDLELMDDEAQATTPTSETPQVGARPGRLALGLWIAVIAVELTVLLVLQMIIRGY